MNFNEPSDSPRPLLFADRMSNIPKSFIREMLKTASSKNLISFAGGLPDEELIPTDALKKAFDSAVAKHGNKLFQYSNSEGYLPLRQWIADRYFSRYGLVVSPEEILLTNGSQQAFDLLGKIFIEKTDKIIIEKPGYLGTLQSLMHFEPEFRGVSLENDGLDTSGMKRFLSEEKIKMVCLNPNFQNPSGTCYSEAKRKEIGELLRKQDAVLVEDDPYGELYFDPTVTTSPMKLYAGSRGIMLGSFSKTLSPGIRLGWMIATPDVMEKIIVSKQAGDLHTNNISQLMIYEYLLNNDFDKHLETIRSCYRERRDVMVEVLEKYLPSEIDFTRPQGGMFLWCRLPENISAAKLVQLTMDAGVVMVPGNVFFTDPSHDGCLRLNFSKSTREEIEAGVKIIGKSVAYLASKNKVYLA